ncbi:hypothetical protein FPE01S_01_13320 [Flavihumibacter petaseus NBRC 106054]|uniref:Uncharacterized protein n=1 Tax=Flavihumibacter petaseus NBRC 106054 TaxID=1220578 RepID=A0A0E9MXS9_9BACT|nr:hypothetical protein FPE01S_01_13320 [Flavihumibacter petaseus NBRC 106054]
MENHGGDPLLCPGTVIMICLNREGRTTPPPNKVNRHILCETIEAVKAVIEHSKTVPFVFTFCTRISTDYLYQIEGFHKSEG